MTSNSKFSNALLNTLRVVPDNQTLRIYDAEDSSTWPEFILKKIESKKRRLTDKTS